MNECTRKIALMVRSMFFEFYLPTHHYLSTSISLYIGCQTMYTITNCMCTFFGALFVLHCRWDVIVVTFLKGIYIHVPINTILNFDGDRKKGLFSVLAYLIVVLCGCWYFSRHQRTNLLNAHTQTHTQCEYDQLLMFDIFVICST